MLNRMRRACRRGFLQLLHAAAAGCLLAAPFHAEAQISFRAASSAGQTAGGGMTNIAFVSAGTASSGTGVNVTPGLPSGWAANDLLLCLVASRDNVAPTMPAGWTRRYSLSYGADLQASLFWKLAGASESTPTVTYGGSVGIVARCFAFRGVSTTSPFDVDHDDSHRDVVAGDDKMTTGSLTTATHGAMILIAGYADRAAGAGDGVTVDGGLTWSSNYFSTYDPSGNASDVAIGFVYAGQGGSGAIGPLSLDTGTNADNQAVVLALRPATALTGLAISKPSGTVDGDVMVASVAVRPRDITISPPPGWTQVQSHQATNTDAASVRMTTWYRVASGEGTSYSWAFSGGTHTGAVGAISSYSGVDNGAPINVSGGNTTASGYTHQADSVTTTTSSTMLVSAHVFSSVTSNWTPPSGMTEAADVASTTRPNTGGVSMENNYKTHVAIGASGNLVATATATGTDAGYGIAHLLALKPATQALNCYTDSFTGADGASPGSNWTTTSSSGSFGQPRIAGNRLRLTDATGNVATAAHLQKMFPGAGNKIIVEFDNFAYGGTGADGVAVTLSDAGVTPQAGAYGGSLGYAQRSGVNGFAGGWLGIGIDEYGNFRNDDEGRGDGGSPTGLVADSVSVRGSGSGTTGYLIHAESGTLSPGVDTGTTTTITYVGSGAAATANSGNVTPTLPTHQSGDFLVCLVVSRDNVSSSIAGWTEYYALNHGTALRSSLFYKFASASESNPTVSHTAGSGIQARCSAFRGVDTSSPFVTAYGTGTISGDDKISTPSISTTGTNGAMALVAGYVDDNVGSGSNGDYGLNDNPQDITFTAAYYSEYNSGGNANDNTLALYYATQTTGGTLGAYLVDTDANADSRGVLMALRPAPAGSSGQRYRIIVDHSDGVHAYVVVDRDTGSGYSTIIPQYDAKAQSGQAAVPTNWLLSYTGSTGGSNNIHEIDNLSVCTLKQILPMGLDHVRLNHTGSAVTCLGEQVTVYACDSADSSGSCTANTGGISGNVVAKNGGTTVATVPFTIAAGSSSTTVTVPVTTPQTVTFETSGLSSTPTASPGWTCWNGSAASCSNTFSDAGFIVAEAAGGAEATVPFQTAGTESAKYWLRAVKKSTTTQACEAALTGATAVSLAYTCNNPASCYTTDAPACGSGSGYLCLTPYSSDGATAQTPSPVAPGGASVTLNFDTNGNAPFTFNYRDAGSITLTATKAAGGSLLASLSGSSNAFVTRPAGFTVAATCTADNTVNAANQTTPGATDPRFCRAGRAFSVTATAVATGGAATPSYGLETTPESVAATWTREAPDPGADGTLPAGAFAHAGGFTGRFTATGLTWSEVGILRAVVRVGDSNYLGAGNVTTTAFIGRFYPDHFDTTPAGQCGGFAYSGRPEVPVVTGQPFAVTATARNGAGGTTANYAGAYARAVDLTVTTGGGTGVLHVDGNPGGNDAIPAANFAAGVGTVAAAAGRISFVFNAFPTAATDVVLHAEDDDTNPSTAGSFTDGAISIRSGRLWLGNAFGSDRTNLTMPYELQFWNGNAFVRNGVDNCSALAIGNLGLGNYLGGINAGNMGIARFAVGLNGGGGGNITITAPAAPAAGSVDVAVALGANTTTNTTWVPTVAPTAGAAMPWLRGRWTGVNFDRDPTARATFGVFGSSQRRGPIYVRENY